MSSILDQIYEIEKQKQESDQTLQKIRAWRQSKLQQQQQQTHETLETVSAQKQEDPEIVSEVNENPEVVSGLHQNPESVSVEEKESVRKEVELVHPWPEWIEFMERLVKQNYFDHRRKDEDKMVKDLGFSDFVENVVDVGIDFNDFKTVQTACLNFGKDRFDILRSLSRQVIQNLVGYGCPSTDKKVVFSAKLLRKHVHLDEGDVCSSCSLRNFCERAYLLTNKEDEARTVDVVRVLLTYGFDLVNGSVANKDLLKRKSVKNAIRKLLHEVVKLSAVPIDPNLPPPVIKKPPPKVKQPPPPPKKRVGRDDIEMKKGDWLCPKCDFMNFAKNAVCLQCDAKRPKRQLLPGEWECPQCNFLNYRRNMACFHCDCKRPPDDFIENKMPERQRGSEIKLEKTASRPEVSNAWNFNFDDDESDGADVAAFEYADSQARSEYLPLDQEEKFRGYNDDFNRASRVARTPERGYSDPGTSRPGMGFDDFDDEDDVDSYEIDTQNNRPVRKVSPKDFSEAEGFSDEEDTGLNKNFTHEATPPSCSRPSKPTRKKAAFADSDDDELGFDTDEDLSVHPNWKSSHVADSKHRSRGRGSTGPSRGLSFGSDEEYGLHSDLEDDFEEDFRSKRTKGNKRVLSGKFQGRASSDMEDGSFSDSESDIDDLQSHRNRSRGNKIEPRGQGNNYKGRGDYSFVSDKQFRSKGKMADRRDSPNNHLNRSSRGSHSDHRGFKRDEDDGWGKNDRRGDSRNFRGPKRGGYGNAQRGRSYKNNMDANVDAGEFRNSRRVIER